MFREEYCDLENILVFHEVKVDEASRRQGIGKGKWAFFTPKSNR